jgi:hypothetical protein
MITTLIFLSQFCVAQEEKSAFEKSLERDTSVSSEESWVLVNGQRLRKFEFNGGRYYLNFKSTTEADIYCAPPKGAENEHLIEGDSQTFRRNAALVRAFHEACAEVKGNQRIDLHITQEMGLGLNEGKGHKVQHKKKP